MHIVNKTNKHIYKVFFNSNNSVSNRCIRRYKFDKCFSNCCSSKEFLFVVVVVELFKIDVDEIFIKFSSSSGLINECLRQLFRICMEKLPRYNICLQTLH